MAAILSQIHGWFTEAVAQNAKFLIVVCDTFDHEDYPVFCNSAKECIDKFEEHNGKNMQRVMEVYDISKGWLAQSGHGLVMNLPPRGSRS